MFLKKKDLHVVSKTQQLLLDPLTKGKNGHTIGQSYFSCFGMHWTLKAGIIYYYNAPLQFDLSLNWQQLELNDTKTGFACYSHAN